jgi:uncharacterized damage-inducible protein DinB
MRSVIRLAAFAVVAAPAVLSAQAPVATAFRDNAKEMGKNLIAAAETMPADKYGFKPTPAQMSFGDVVLHLAGGNDAFCSAIGGVKAPTRSKLAATDGKAALTARLKETFDFCSEALAKLDDSKLAEPMNMFGMSSTRAGFMLIAADDWGDHYSQSAIYLRLNGLLPPTAKPPAK